MTETHVMHALKRKCAEIAGRLERAESDAAACRAELDHLDATIRIFDPDVDVGAVKSRPFPPRHSAFKREMVRIIYDATCDTDTPLSSAQIPDEVIRQRGLNADDRGLVQVFRRRTIAALGTLRTKGAASSSLAPNGRLLWSRAAKEADDR